jgi:RNA polymerase sigma factor (sigma-70 family)
MNMRANVAHHRARRDRTGGPAGSSTELMGDEAPEVELLARVGRQDVAALGELYDRFAPRAFGLLTYILSSEEEAETTLQEVFMQLWNEGGSLGVEGGSVAAWLIIASREAALERLHARRTGLSQARSSQEGVHREKRVAVKPHKSKRPGTAPSPSKTASRISGVTDQAGKPATAALTAAVRVLNPWLPRPGEIALIEDRLELLHKVVHRLPESQQKALEFALFRGLSDSEIARELGEPLGKVRSGLRAAVTFVKHRRLAILGKWAANI